MKPLVPSVIALALIGVVASGLVVLHDSATAMPTQTWAPATEDRSREAFGQPLPGLPDALRDAFFRGRTLFRQNWVIAPSRDTEVDGLGPLHNRISCIACHNGNGKGHAPNGPGERARALLLRLSVDGQDKHGGPRPHPVYGDQLNEDSIPGVPPEGRVRVSWQEKIVKLADGEPVSLRRPSIAIDEPGYGPLGPAQVSARIGPGVFGLGLLESVEIQTLKDLAAESRSTGMQGRLNIVYDAASNRQIPGRYGLKSNRSTLRDQIAAAMHGDLGITTTLMPAQNCTPVQSACRSQPHGGMPELTDTQLDDLEVYLAWLAPPAPRPAASAAVKAAVLRGQAAFGAMGCAACHRPELPLGKHHLLGDLSGQRIAAYTDLLLHDMGEDLADHRPDFLASGREWRTPPLWGISLLHMMNDRVGYLHDGRARTVQEAILWHGGAAAVARDRYATAPREERQALLEFVESR
ncbi:di-heme oxidoredictase family protein [Imbroritus primus]